VGDGEGEVGGVCVRSCVCQVVCIDRTLLIRVHRPSRVRGWGVFTALAAYTLLHTHTHITPVVQSCWAVMAIKI
jgi:hypothetical protein